MKRNCKDCKYHKKDGCSLLLIPNDLCFQFEYKKQNCKNCKYFDKSEFVLGNGECHRFPDSVTKCEGDYCGEFKTKKL